MKKIILTCLLLVGGSLAMHINAQTKTSFGLKIDANMVNLKLTKMKNKNNSFDAGASLGGFTKIEFSENFALQPELMMSYTERKIKIGDERLKYKYSSVEVPIYALGQLEAGRGKFFFGMGPIIGYGFDSDDAEVKIGNSPELDDFFELDSDNYIQLGLNHWYYGGGFIWGYELHNGLTFHVGYQRTHAFRSENKKKSKIEVQTISLGIGYKF